MTSRSPVHAEVRVLHIAEDMSPRNPVSYAISMLMQIVCQHRQMTCHMLLPGMWTLLKRTVLSKSFQVDLVKQDSAC